jgi:flagellar hook-basal body complex protein FliE
MNVEAINDGLEFLPPSNGIKFDAAAAPSNSFAAWLDKGLSNVNEQIISSDTQLRQLAAGEVDNLHQVMISMEQAKLSFQLALQVRNRVLEAYQEVLRMQI